MINIDQFREVELKTAKVISAERVEGSDKLLKLRLDAGDKSETGEAVERQILAGIGKAYMPEEMVGKTIVVVANLEPRQMMGMESNGMLLAASAPGGEPVILTPEKEIQPGSNIS